MKILKHPITSIREPFGKAGLIVACLALVFAMAGGALAAKGALTGKQKKEVEKIAKKYAGKPGAPGTNGTNGSPGAKGDTGAAGAAGTNGTNGENGKAGESVTNKAIAANPANANCKEGGAEFKVGSGSATFACNGTTGFTKTLPSKATETGLWTIAATGESESNTAISFTIPLAAPLGKPEATSGVHYVGNEGNGTTCLGTVAEPAAKPGNLCVYQAGVSNMEEEELPSGEMIAVAKVENPTTLEGIVLGGSTTSGALLHLKPVSPTEAVSATGTWAVTAE